MGKILNVLEQFQKDKRYRDRIAHIEVLGPKRPRHKQAANLSPKLLLFLKTRNIKLYAHQAKAVSLLSRGKNLVITTPTASGKTLAFNMPIFEKLDQDPRACALYLYPAKALAQDQLKKIRDMEKSTGIDAHAAVYDGDTPQSKRSRIRAHSRIVVSNPYQMHHILSWHYQWERFYKNLKFVVIDEAHQYRGVFGSNIAMLLRRLRRILDYYGASPQFVLSTATLANPLEFASKLTGLDFDWVGEDSTPRGKKYFMLYNPSYDRVGPLSAHQETTDLLLALLGQDIQTLCFTVSRKMAELVGKWAREALENKNGPLAERITAYRAGYLARERREIEQGIRDGRLLGIISTNALELGMDIGRLDAVIMSGFPGTIISTWQQAGRAGRGTGESMVILVAFENPLDQYLVKHPAYFFESSPENAVIDLTNPYINAGQLMCASAELPIRKNLDEPYFGKRSLKLLEDFSNSGLMKKTPHGWIYCGKDYPSSKVHLESAYGDQFKVVCAGRILETMSLVQVYREAYPGAVMLHRGETYTVNSLDMAQGLVDVQKKDVDYYTTVRKDVHIDINQEIKTQEKGDFSLFMGQISVKETYFAYKVIKYDRVLDTVSLHLPPLEFHTVGLWFTMPEKLQQKLVRSGLDFGGGLHGIEHAMIALMPLVVMCDRWDVGGVSYPFYSPNQKPTIFIYDAYQGGIGLSEKAFELFGKLAVMTHELVKDCGCTAGCPACIYSPKCGNENQPLDKKASEIILAYLQKLF